MKKLTEEQIIKAMQCVIGNGVSCSECEYQKVLPFPSCRRMCAEQALDLINRKNAKIEELKTEIERLENQNTLLLKKKCKDINIPRKIIKSKAIGVMIIELGKKEIKKTRSSDS